MTELSRLSSLWIELKEAERKATEERREVEDTIMSLVEIGEGLDGTATLQDGDYSIKIVGRKPCSAGRLRLTHPSGKQATLQSQNHYLMR